MVQSKCAHPAAFHPPGSGICLHSAKREEWVKYKRLCRTPSNTACCPIGERNVDSTPLLIMSNKGPLAPIKNNRGSCTFCSEAIKRTDFKRKKGPLTHHLLGRLQPMGKNAAYRQNMSAKKQEGQKKKGGKKITTHFRPYLQGESLIFSQSQIKSITDQVSIRKENFVTWPD